eukprot:g2616.t1
MRRVMSKSRVVQVTISDVSDAPEVFARHENKYGGTPIVLVPEEPKFFSCCLTIPDGFWVLCQKWYEDKGIFPAGFVLFWPGWMRISHIVTKKGISYNHPVFNCPTRDNVMVEVDVSLTFQIGPTLDDAKRFVYYLGAHRFDELLSAETEEAIRALVNDVAVMKVHDLREEFAGDMRDSLNKSMRRYGVEIQAVKVTDVKLPVLLEQTLQRRTSYETQIEQDEKKHVAEKRKIIDDAQQTIEEIKKLNLRTVQELNATIDRELISREEQVTAARTVMSVAIVNAETRSKVRQIKAKADLEASAYQGECAYVEALSEVEADCKKRRDIADQDLASRTVRAKARYAVKLKEAECVQTDARVERIAGKELQEKRAFEVSEMRMRVLTGIAQHSRMVIAGDAGERLLQQFSPGSVHDMSAATNGTFVVSSDTARTV